MAGNYPSPSSFLRKVKIQESGCWEWQGMLNDNGYGIQIVKKKRMRAHRLSMSMFVGSIPDGLMVCHHCDNRKCVRPSHLFLGTGADNTADASTKGRLFRKLNHDAIESIRDRANCGESFRSLAREFGVSAPALIWVARGHGGKQSPGNPLVESRKSGDNHPLSKLTDEQVRLIRDLLDTKQATRLEMAERFGVTRWHIGLIHRRKARSKVA